MTPWLDDGDVRLYHGDVREVLAAMPDESVDCVVTSPPYWQLRDYAGMGTWEGGEAGCDHAQTVARHDGGRVNVQGFNGSARDDSDKGAVLYRGKCGKCGAVRHDFQIGLEPTIEEYVETLVGVFRDVRRVLARHGTCWLNVGDSYASTDKWGGGVGGNTGKHTVAANGEVPSWSVRRKREHQTGLKPKDLCLIPFRVALALQADGWWVRQRNVWAKPNPMPESVTDRTTSAAEEVFHLTKIGAGYYYDAEAVREPHETGDRVMVNHRRGVDDPDFVRTFGPNDERVFANNPAGRNLRNVWTIATEPTPEAHFATFPLELVRRCLAAGCPERVCRECGEPSRRVVERERLVPASPSGNREIGRWNGGGEGQVGGRTVATGETWTDCGHDAYRPGIVLDPFVGSGKTCQQARRMGLHAIGIDGSAEYLEIAARRLQQLSLLTETGGQRMDAPAPTTYLSRGRSHDQA